MTLSFHKLFNCKFYVISILFSLFCVSFATAQDCTFLEKYNQPTSSINNSFGGAVAGYDNQVVVGAPADKGGELNSGAAYVFSWDGTDWSEEKLPSTLPLNGDEFGSSVDIAEDRIIVGARRSSINTGNAYIFMWDGSNWIEHLITPSNGMPNGFFGWSVAIEGDIAVVGAPYSDSPLQDGGTAYIFEYDGVSWNETAILVASDNLNFDLFGIDVSTSTGRIVVGARSQNATIGACYVYDYDGTNWIESKIVASDAQSNDHFGASVAISGDNMIVGATGAAGNATASGVIYLFEFNGTAWIETEIIFPADGSSGDGFGGSVDFDSDLFVVGARFAGNTNGGGAGNAYIYEFDGTDWIGTKYIATNGGGNDNFGSSVAVSIDVAAFGAPATNNISTKDGIVSLYQNDGTNWNESIEWPMDYAPALFFGNEVAIDGSRFIVGAKEKDNIGFGDAIGKVFLYDDQGSGYIETLFEPTGGGDPNDFFGNSIDILGDRFVIGCPGDSDLGSGAGVVYIYDYDGTTWQEFKLFGSDITAGSSFGYDVALINDTLAVGASDGIYIFTWDGTNWNETKIDTIDGMTGIGFGGQLDISGNTIVLGSPGYNNQFTSDGAMYIFSYDGTDWNQTDLIFPSLPSNTGNFGADVSISGDNIAVAGSLFADKIWFYNYDSGLQQWNESSLPVSINGYDYNISIDGNKAILGDTETTFGDSFGKVYTFQLTGSCWAQVDEFTSNEPYPAGRFGKSVDIDGDQFIVGSFFKGEIVELFDCPGMDPIASCQDITVNLDVNGEVTIVAEDVNLGSSVPCGNISYSIDNDLFFCNDIGTNTVILTVTDDGGATSTCSAEVTVQDLIPPVIVAQDITLSADANGDVNFTVADVLVSVADNCSSTLNPYLEITSYSCQDGNYFGTTLFAEDDSGNVGSDVFFVTIDGNTSPPAFSCIDVTVSLDESGQHLLDPSEVILRDTTDLGGFIPLEGALCASANDVYDATTNTMTLVASDDVGAGGTGANNCFEISHIYQTELSEDGKICFDYEVIDLGIGDIFAYSVGVDWSVTEATYSNISSLTTTVTDSGTGSTSSPTTLCFDGSEGDKIALIVYSDYYANGSLETININGEIIIGTDPTADWNLLTTCTPSQNSGDGVNSTVGLKTYDEHILSLAYPIEYRIETTTSWADGQGYLYETTFDPLDICNNLVAWDGDSGPGFESIVNFTNDPAIDYIYELSTWSTTQQGTYDLEITSGSLGAGMMSIDISNIEFSTSTLMNVCGIASQALSQTLFTCADVGSNNIDLIVTDINNNSNSCSLVVTVEDNFIPISSCKDITVSLDAQGQASINNLDIFEPTEIQLEEFTPYLAAVICPGVSSYDPALNTIELVASDPSAFGGGGANTCSTFGAVYQTPIDFNGEVCFDWEITNAGVGDKFGYSLTTDWSVVVGSTQNLNANTIILADSVNPGGPSPSQVCLPVVPGNFFSIIVYTDYFANGNSFLAGALTANVNNIVGQNPLIDNCNISYTLSQEDFNCTDIGVTTVTLTQTDDSGNSSSCTSNVTVEDNLSPSVVVQDITLSLDANGEVDLTPMMIDDGSIDNCGIDNMTIDVSNFDCSNIEGSTPNPFSIDLVSTVATSNNFVNTIKIKDGLIYLSQRPSDIIKVYDLTGALQFSFGSSGSNPGEFGEPESIAFDSSGDIYVSDRFDGQILKFDPTGVFISEFNTENIEGIYIHNDIIYAAHDNIGEVRTYDLSGNLIETLFNFSGATGIDIVNNLIYVANNASTGNVGVYDLTGNLVLSFPVGGWSNRISADECGNIYVARWNDATATIFDSSGTELESLATGVISGQSVGNQYISSNLYGEIKTYDVSCFGQKTHNPVVLTVSDINGNVGTAISKVSIEDNLPPIAVCKDITIQVPADGTSVNVTGMDVDDDSSDNCNIESYTLDISEFSITDKGSNSVLLTVTDEYGNSSSCSTTITVECACEPGSSTLIPNTAAGLHQASYKNDDGQYTHYCDAQQRLLLSIDSPSAATIPASEVTINITPGGFYYEQYCTGSGGSEDGSCFISNEDGSVVLCRTWDVDNAATDAFIRFYFDQGDLDIVNEELAINGFDPMTDPSQMWFYKVINDDGHQKPEDLALVDVGIIHNDGSAIPAYANWTLGMTSNSYFAEYQVTSFSGGGGGGAQGGSSPICPAMEASITGDEILNTAGTGDVFINIIGGTAPYEVTLSDGTFVSNYTSGDAISVSFTATTSYSAVTVYDSNSCPASTTSGLATKYVSTGDTTPPTASCQDITVSLSAYGTTSIDVSEIDNGSADNEGIATATIDQYYLDCSSTPIVTLTVTDISGNSDQCTANITINDPWNVCCPTTKTIPYTPTEEKEYQADEFIFTNALIKLGSGSTDIIMHAGTEICLEPGFEVEVGTIFEAYIGPCQ